MRQGNSATRRSCRFMPTIAPGRADMLARLPPCSARMRPWPAVPCADRVRWLRVAARISLTCDGDLQHALARLNAAERIAGMWRGAGHGLPHLGGARCAPRVRRWLRVGRRAVQGGRRTVRPGETPRRRGPLPSRGRSLRLTSTEVLIVPSDRFRVSDPTAWVRLASPRREHLKLSSYDKCSPDAGPSSPTDPDHQ